MTDTGTPEAVKPEDKTTEGELPAEVKPPEPWTARKVFEWNSYYDLYVAGFLILLAFLGSANQVPASNSVLWSLLNAGRQTATTGRPVVTDSTSTAGEGRRWVNVPWLFELAHYGIFSAGSSLYRPEPGTPVVVGSVGGEQFGVGALIAVDALIRGLTALLLLGLRRKGPGLWWSAFCVMMALGVTLGPATVPISTATPEGAPQYRQTIGIQLGGIASSGSVVVPETWGLFLLAVELLLLHQAMNLGKAGRIFWLVPLFLLWANVDESFGFGFLVLAASVLGLLVGPRPSPKSDPSPARPSSKSGLIALGLCLLATLANPSHVFGIAAGFGWIPKLVGLDVGPASTDPVSLFGSRISKVFSADVLGSWRLQYAALVGLGVASFALDRRRFSLGRFLAFATASACWALGYFQFTGAFALVLVATLSLNGQEWYHDAFGTEGKLGTGWTIWSTGGRLATLTILVYAITRSVTGWGSQVGEPQFGFGFNPDDFPFEAAEEVRATPIEGTILNTSYAEGDVIAWRAGSKPDSKLKAYIDSRPHLYPPSVLDDWSKLRFALRDDKIEDWRPVLDKYKASAVMIQLIGDPTDRAPNTYIKLMTSPNWIPYYDDGSTVIFGRADAGAIAKDVAYFKENRLDPELRAYKKPRPVPPWQRPPTAVIEAIDSIFQNRVLKRPQPHLDAARRWLSPVDAPAGRPFLADPARCLMAIREARTALAIKPDDSTAFQILIEAYQRLLAQESALLSNIPLTTENIPKILQAPSQSRILPDRVRQILSSLNFRLQTLPPSRNADERRLRIELNYNLAQLYMQNGAYDLARERLATLLEVAATAPLGELRKEDIERVAKQQGDLDGKIKQVQDRLNEMVIGQGISPIDKARAAAGLGCPGQAIRELDEANDAGGNPSAVRPLLIDLYCEVGMPDKAFDVIRDLPVEDASLATLTPTGPVPGSAAYRQGLVFLLLGNYANAVELWRDRSLLAIRRQLSLQAPASTQMFLSGEPVQSTRMFLEIPERVRLQAQREFELGMAALEGGTPAFGQPPKSAADHLENALKLEPDLAARPVIAYYLEKLGRPVPPPRTPSKVAESVPTTAPTTAPTLPTTPPPTLEPPPTLDKPADAGSASPPVPAPKP